MRTTSQPTRRRRRILSVMAIVLMILGIGGLAVAIALPKVHQESMAHKPLPGPALQSVPSGSSAKTPGTSTGTTPSKTTSSQPTTKGSTPTPPTDKPAVTIAPGKVQQIYIPSQHKLMVVNAPVAAMPTSCKQVIDPPRDDRFRGVFQCTDFADAGTTSSGTVVLAGHSSSNHAYNTMFDHLSCTATSCGATTVAEGCNVEQSTLPGREVDLRTDTSGTHWLVYRVTDVYCPSKDTSTDIATKKQLWKATPGRLLLVTCLEQANTSYSADNLIAVAEFVGVK